MRVFDILILSLLVFPWLVQGLPLNLLGLHFSDMSDLRIPLLVAALIAYAFAARARLWRLLTGLGRLRGRTIGLVVLLAVAVVAAALLVERWAARMVGVDLNLVLWSLTHGVGAALLITLLAVALQRWSPESWETSFSVRHGARLAEAWRRAVERSPALVLWVTAALVGTGLSYVSCLRHWAVETHGYDLGIFTNALWNLAHGNGYLSSIKGGINLFEDHQSPTFWALAPLFWLLPRPETLLFAQGLGLAAGGPALYYLTRRRFGEQHWAPAVLPWVYWAYLPMRNANAFEFHPEVFMLPLFLWAFVGFGSPRPWGKALGVLALAGALGAKESAPVVATGIGIAWALSGPRRWPGIALAAAGVAVFLFDVKVVPRIFGADYPYMGLYQRFGGGLTDLVLAPFLQPAFFFSEVLDAPRLNFLYWTLAPLGFLPLFSWRAALAALPPYLMLFLSEGDRRLQLIFHYGIEPASALFWALPLGLAAFARRVGWSFAGLWMLIWVLAAHGPTELARARSFERFPHAAWLAGEALPCVNRELPIVASDSLVPHLSTRPWVGYLDQIHQRPPQDPVRCVVTDLTVENWPLGRYGMQEQLRALRAAGYREAYSCHDFKVHEIGAPGCLRCVPNCY
jgi:uncharacterized membrane protein